MRRPDQPTVNALLRWSLVSCPVNNGAKSLDLPEDRIRGGGPEEGASVAIVVLHELIDLGHELREAGKGAAADGALRDERKPALNLIEPGRVGRREVEVVAGMPGEPAAYLGVLVGPVVVHDEVHVEVRRDLGVEVAQERQELLVPMARLALMEHGSRGHVQGGKERRRAVALGVVGDPFARTPAGGARRAAGGPSTGSGSCR